MGDTEGMFILWRRDVDEAPDYVIYMITVALGFAAAENMLFLFSPLDGGVIDGIATGSGFAMTPAAFGRRAFVMSNGGSMVRLSVTPPSM